MACLPNPSLGELFHPRSKVYLGSLAEGDGSAPGNVDGSASRDVDDSTSGDVDGSDDGSSTRFVSGAERLVALSNLAHSCWCG